MKRPLVLDGAMGSLLEKMGLTETDFAWSAKANVKYPDKVLKIHKSYIEAGADIITTNTFRTNPYSLGQVGIKNFERYVKKAISIACEAKENLPVLIAGSNAPAEDCYQVKRTISKKQLELNHCYHIDSLIEYGCHFILNETLGHFDEIKIISKHCEKYDIPFVMSLYFDENLCLLSGEKLSDVINFLNDTNVLSIGFNCISDKILIKLINQLSLPPNWGFYLNCFSTSEKQTEVCSISVAEYLVTVQEVIHFNPSFIGACCGSNPEFIKAIKGFLDGRIKH
ncbi:homocysteine S-methyltransferase family protein [Ignavibacterium sp.]|uniref:homocysteine S-methyltransferase family protein n=1 Tax=Ignavibacterium sp. TaxID=2651167 RepID=UPI002602E889|nr:homocysteine S-methyltransferase family protein [Ignavibacterium sp.]